MSSHPKKYKTTFLFVKPKLFIGIGSIFNIYGNYWMFNYSKSGGEADAKALENDWGVIGQDIKEAIKKAPKKALECAK